MNISDLQVIKIPNMTTVGEVLDNHSSYFDYFRKVFDRVCTLYVRGIKNDDEKYTAKQIVGDWFKNKSINEMDCAIQSYRDKIIIDVPKVNDFELITEESFSADDSTIFLLNYFAVSTILKTYQYCSNEENKEIGASKKSFNEDHYDHLIDVLNNISKLEDITSQHFIGEAIHYFIEKTIENERKGRSKGGYVKNENYKAKMHPIFDEAYQLFKNPNLVGKEKWKNKSECAKFYIKEFYAHNRNTDIDLDIRTLVKAITERINEHCASKKITLLAEDESY